MNGNRLNYLFSDVNNVNSIKTVSLENINEVKLKKKNIYKNIFSMNKRSFKARINELMILLGCIEN